MIQFVIIADETKGMNQLLEAALKYAQLGWQVFPLVPKQKVPITAHGVKDATSDTDQIKVWWAKWPDANIAVACGKESGVYVIDVDVTKAGDVNGYESLKEFPPLPETITQDTPRGGFHAFFHTDNPPANRNNFRPGIDIRGDGYYVVLSPSIHPNGGVYTWKLGCAPWELVPAEFPDFMRPTKRAPWVDAQPQQKPISAPMGPTGADVVERASLYLAECEPAIQGQGGHSKLLWAASAMVNGFLLSDDQALDLLIREYNPRCVPPWNLGIKGESRDFRRKVTEARKLTPDKPRGWLLEDAAYAPQPLLDIDVPKLIANKKMTFQGVPIVHNPILDGDLNGELYITRLTSELEFLTHPTGLLGEICEWINSTAIRKQPFLTLACALTFCGVLFGRKICDSLGSRTNLYCMGVAPSSAGKAHAPNQIRKLCQAAGCTDLLGGEDVASDSAIEDRMERHPASLFLWDEIGYLLSHIRSGISQYHVRIVPLLMKLYSAAGSIYKGREYAESEKQRTIIQPCCCIHGTSTPERFSSGISPEELQDGWLSRCLVFRTYSHPTKSRGDCDVPVPQSICDQVSAWYTRQIGVTDGQDISAYAVYRGSTGVTDAQPPEQIVVPRTPEAEKLFLSLDDESVALGKANPVLACLWTKSEENARRVALIVAASENFEAPEITGPIADYACRLIRYLLLNFARDTVPAIVTCHIDAQKQKLLRIINQAGIDGCLTRHITRAARWSTKKQRDALLADLIEAEEIVGQIKGKGICYWTIENYRKYLVKQGEQ